MSIADFFRTVAQRLEPVTQRLEPVTISTKVAPQNVVVPKPQGFQPVVYTDVTRDGVVAIQKRLIDLGYLDPPADGGMGGTTRWALHAVTQGSSAPFVDHVDSLVSAILKTAKPLALNPDLCENELLKAVVKQYIKDGYFIARHPDCVNTNYVEGHETNGALNANRHNAFDDVRMAWKVEQPSGKPVLLGIWEATTHPGTYWTLNPMNSGGAFHIKPGQYKAWSVGYHHTHEAWTQTGSIDGYRDARKNFTRNLDHPVSGSEFGVNQHWGYDLSKNDLANSSAGCLVGRSTNGHKEYMRITKGDARWKGNAAYRLMTAVFTQDEIADCKQPAKV